ncbi:TIGR03986 family CRISPR-associated RAMP protein [Pseudoalteromonas sp. SCSIO 43201]|uniref:TIGR03986 family type III CRISPR-associated RAMP protein n=1 Tax=Pseudoalteromonas sp. SCSIO 43201 TaxID=2822842 RepID=UPI00207607E3|nr:TIGR03986 family CRISPR-associated RAMP protein [Pseudoalteromonas sp. SCSIO 43201]USD27238.1 TIGR03986 family CRISPR-associated RAMP protein [Pseudoalteromonas sp. SCSIO 43201]
MSHVHAPYHFVPLSKWVYMPEWAQLVSHDVPFQDGLSGSIEYTLTNKTPLCVGSQHHQQENQPTKVLWHRNPHGQFVIPGTSLKGAIRNTLEISSFSKFKSIDDQRLSYRTISSGSEYLKEVSNSAKVEAGWIKYCNKSSVWQLSLCNFAKVKHTDLKPYCRVNIRNEMSAVEKYQALPITTDIEFDTNTLKRSKDGTHTIKHVGQGGTKGSMVFCNNRVVDELKGKPEYYEFSYCFYGKSQKVVSGAHINTLVDGCLSSHNEKQVQFLKMNPHPEKGIPVFVLIDKKNQNIKALGLAKLPRMMYKHSFSELVDRKQKDASKALIFDMAECIFGTLREEGLSLKSRVSFTDAICQKKLTPTCTKVILGSPKPSFLAAYLEQPLKDNYVDYNSHNAELAGWKRYKSLNKFESNYNQKEHDNDRVLSEIELLPSDTQFNGRVVFHNLKPEELGAILWSLTYGEKSQCLHQIGHGKSLGAGACAIEVEALSCNGEARMPTEFIERYVQTMERAYPSEHHTWSDSPQLRHLIALANPATHEHTINTYIDFNSGDYKKIQNGKLSMPQLEVAGKSLPRKEPEEITTTTAANFAKGRLAALITDEIRETLWYKMHSEEAEKRQERASLDAMPDDVREIATLKLRFERTEKLARQHLHVEVVVLCHKALEKQLSPQAIRELIDLISDETVDFQNVGKKKKKDRERLIKSVKELM